MTKLNLSLDETARALCIGKTKLRELISTGALKSVRIGEKPLVRVTEIERFLQKLEATT